LSGIVTIRNVAGGFDPLGHMPFKRDHGLPVIAGKGMDDEQRGQPWCKPEEQTDCRNKDEQRGQCPCDYSSKAPHVMLSTPISLQAKTLPLGGNIAMSTAKPAVAQKSSFLRRCFSP